MPVVPEPGVPGVETRDRLLPRPMRRLYGLRIGLPQGGYHRRGVHLAVTYSGPITPARSLIGKCKPHQVITAAMRPRANPATSRVSRCLTRFVANIEATARPMTANIHNGSHHVDVTIAVNEGSSPPKSFSKLFMVGIHSRNSADNDTRSTAIKARHSLPMPLNRQRPSSHSPQPEHFDTSGGSACLQ